MDNFTRVTDAFNYVYEKSLEEGEIVILAMPAVSPNKRSVNDIGWQTDGDATLYGTLSSSPENESALWQELKDGDEVNKTVSAIKIVNGGTACNVAIRVIMC